MPKREFKYFLSIIFIFSFSIYFLLLLLKKYSTLTFEHFWETCEVIASNFFSLGAHYLGFILTAIVIAITLGLFLKTILSYIKTKRKIHNLLKNELLIMPKKLGAILEKNNIRKDSIIILKGKEDYALTIDWFTPKIVVSSNLLEKLTGKQLEAVILHEYYHSKNKHPLLLIVGEILSSSLSLLPILKEISAKMRIVLEKEADRFVSEQQGTTRNLDLALEMVSSQNRFKLYPTLSQRNDYKIKKINFLISLLVILIGIFLFEFPATTQRVQAVGNSTTSNCGENLCSTHCPGDDIHQSSNITPAFQTTITSKAVTLFVH